MSAFDPLRPVTRATRTWKFGLIHAVARGQARFDDIARAHNISAEEWRHWCNAYARGGARGLQATRRGMAQS